AAHRLGDRDLVDAGVHERNLEREGQKVDQQATPCQSSEGTVGIKEVRGAVFAPPDQVEVRQVDGGPRNQEVEKGGQVVLERVHEVARAGGRDQQADHGDAHAHGDPQG